MTEKRNDIQGLRGIAVLSVVVFHVAHAWLPGGFAGVDMFFVLSGYLISQILLRDFQAGTFSLRDFYRRRVMRLFPALFCVLAFALIAGLLILPPKLLSEEVFSQFFTTLFLSNYAFARQTGYFEAQATLKPLLHTWSLGVEEQFYLAFPLFLLLVRQFLRRWLWPLIAALAVLSLGLAEVFQTIKADAAFYLPWTRAFELLIGALCVWVEANVTLTDAHKRWMSLGGLALIVLSLVILNDRLPFPGVWALPPCLGVACLLLSRGAWGNRLIAAPPLVFTGDLSYSLYLWHWPLLVYARIVLGDSLWVALPVAVLAYGVAILSRRYIELPVLSGPPKRLWLWAVLAMILSVVSALAIYGAKGVPSRFNAAEQRAFAAADDASPERKGCHLGENERRAYARTCVLGDAEIAPAIAVWSDSEGVELAYALAKRLEPRHISVRQISSSACPPSVGYGLAYNPVCREHNADMLLHLKSDPHLSTVILVANYRRYENDDPDAMLSGLELSALDLLASGKQVVIVYPVPVYDFDPPSEAGLALRMGRPVAGVGMSRVQYDAENARVITELDAFVNNYLYHPKHLTLDAFAYQNKMAVLRPSDALCDAARCYAVRGGDVLYFNGQHLSVNGADLLAAKLAK